LECGSYLKVYVEPSEILTFTKYYPDKNEIIFRPPNEFIIGTYQVNLLLDNNMGMNSSFVFNLDVYDEPRFSSKLQTVYEMGVGSKMIISLPVIPEFHPISVINNNVPEFAKLKYLNYSVNPKSVTHIGDFLVQGTVFNKHTFRNFRFRIRVINNPPRFMS
jgi:hypothetical protein